MLRSNVANRLFENGFLLICYLKIKVIKMYADSTESYVITDSFLSLKHLSLQKMFPLLPSVKYFRKLPHSLSLEEGGIWCVVGSAHTCEADPCLPHPRQFLAKIVCWPRGNNGFKLKPHAEQDKREEMLPPVKPLRCLALKILSSCLPCQKQ